MRQAMEASPHVKAHANEYLSEYFLERRQRNPAFSLRAFARLIQVSPSSLSEILSDKRSLTSKVGSKIASRLSLSPEETKRFLAAIAKSQIEKRAARELARLDTFSQGMRQIHATAQRNDSYFAIADNNHFAILSLLETRDFRLSHRWIASRLNISVDDSRDAINRLLRLGLVIRDGKRLIVCQDGCAALSRDTNHALRNSYRASLHKALEALDGVPTDLRDFSSITLAIPRENVALAKTLILRFRRFAAKLLETGERTEVYSLCIQFFPVSAVRKS